MTIELQCSRCKIVIPPPAQGSITNGYGTAPDGSIVCYSCCADDDKNTMRANGKITLYLSYAPKQFVKYGSRWGGDKFVGTVGNFPNSLSFPVNRIRKGSHNIARVRYDVYFTFEGENWWGVQYGDNTQICHCRKIK